jgi:signal transduction histidine kinase
MDFVTIDFEPRGTGMLVEADKSRLIEVISNLLSNAIKFTSRGSIKVVTDKLRRTDSKMDQESEVAVVQVVDTGTGIDREVMPKLFTKFVTKSETGGTGLGLYLSKSIVEAHGGKIWAENNSEGKGSIFTFTLPLVSASGLDVEAEEKSAKVGGSSSMTGTGDK